MLGTLHVKVKRKVRLPEEVYEKLKRYKVLKSKKKEEEKQSCRKFKQRRNEYGD